MIEDFKRPNHTDFKDSFELRKEGFSGVRHNSISQEWEIWIDGERKAFGADKDVEAFAAAYAEVFFCKDVQLVEMKGN